MRLFNCPILVTFLTAIQTGKALSGITVDGSTCQGVLLGRINAALIDMGNMARFAHDCTAAMQAGTPPQCNPTVLLSTFQAYFGSITNGAITARGSTILCMNFNLLQLLRISYSS